MNKQKHLATSKTSQIVLKLFFIISVSLFVLAACGGGSDDPDPSPNPAPDPKPTPEEIVPEAGMNLYGMILDEKGNPIKNVVVSDGFNCVLTDAKGIYQMKKNENAKFVFYSTPSDYAVNTAATSLSMASFYQNLVENKERYDFSLKKITKESDFAFICMGDPQVTNNEEITRYEREVVADLKKTISGIGKPVYGLVLGDIAGDKPNLYSLIRRQLGATSMPTFVTIGNHDKVALVNKPEEPRNADLFMASFGPLDYSFNRGDVHFICLDNISYSNGSDYSAGFTDDQVEWMKQDLSHVSKDKMVVLYYHIPLRDSKSIKNREAILNLLKGYADVHLMCGHTHYTENYITTSPRGSYEHVHGATCGAWWRSVINGDGTPIGYAVYHVSGNKISNWYYKSVNYDLKHQIRLFRGDAQFGGRTGWFSYDKGSNVILANIWNSDDEWIVDIYEDGKKVGEMDRLPNQSKGDAWAKGYHIGELGRNPDSYSQAQKHLYQHTLVNPNATSIKVIAKDRFGNKYTEEVITTTLDAAKEYPSK